MDATSDRLWAVVLAAGEGTRMASLTRHLYGWDVPKQFATLVGDRSMLQLTMERIAPLIPPDRTIVVVDESHEVLARVIGHALPLPRVVTQQVPFHRARWTSSALSRLRHARCCLWLTPSKERRL